MSEEAGVYMTAPDVNGRPALPKRTGPKSMLPSTWIGRSLRVEYADAFGSGQVTSGMYLDWCPVGIIMNVAGARMLIPWDRLALVELVED